MTESIARDYGKINAWELCTRGESPSEGENKLHMTGNIQISPSDADYFLHLFFSSSTDRVGAEYRSLEDGWVHLHLTGPPGRNGRSSTGFKLSRNALLRCLPGEGDRDAFACRLWELGYNEEDITLACKALGLRNPNHP